MLAHLCRQKKKIIHIKEKISTHKKKKKKKRKTQKNDGE